MSRAESAADGRAVAAGHGPNGTCLCRLLQQHQEGVYMRHALCSRYDHAEHAQAQMESPKRSEQAVHAAFLFDTQVYVTA